MQNGLDGFITQEFEYSNHGGRPLTMRLVRPRGDGPFPIILDLHGGAWCNSGPDECKGRDEALAAAGIAAAAVDFRHGDDAYPTSLIDINHAIRWVKANATKLAIRADRVALCGQSSGGHLAMLAAMRPHDPRYTTVALPPGSPGVDGTVACVAMTWPVINPLSRYRHFQRALDSTNPPSWASRSVLNCHDRYWKTEARMAEGNPMLALERGENVVAPPAVWIQARPDHVHDYRDPESPIPGNEPERFATNYRHAGGELAVRYIEIDRYDPRAAHAANEMLIEFFHKHLV